MQKSNHKMHITPSKWHKPAIACSLCTLSSNSRVIPGFLLCFLFLFSMPFHNLHQFLPEPCKYLTFDLSESIRAYFESTVLEKELTTASCPRVKSPTLHCIEIVERTKQGCISFLGKDMFKKPLLHQLLRLVKNTDEGKQNMLPQNKPLWHQKDFQLKVIAKQQTQGKPSAGRSLLCLKTGEFSFQRRDFNQPTCGNTYFVSCLPYIYLPTVGHPWKPKTAIFCSVIPLQMHGLGFGFSLLQMLYKPRFSVTTLRCSSSGSLI